MHEDYIYYQAKRLGPNIYTEAYAAPCPYTSQDTWVGSFKPQLPACCHLRDGWQVGGGENSPRKSLDLLTRPSLEKQLWNSGIPSCRAGNQLACTEKLKVTLKLTKDCTPLQDLKLFIPVLNI